MAVITVKTAGNTTELHYEEYGSGQPIILIHGWPLTHRAWEKQYGALVDAGYRVIAYDRRGFGMSDKPWSGYDYNTFADDLHAVITSLNLNNAIIVGFSMGGGEVARYIGRHGTGKIAAAMLISAVTPYMRKDDSNPHGVNEDVFDGMRAGVAADRFGFIANWRENFVNADVLPDKVSTGMLDFLSWQANFALPKAMIDCITAFGTTDFRNDLQAANVPTLVVHGADDRICPLDVCATQAMRYLPNATLNIIDGAPHGLNMTHSKELNDSMLSFLSQL